LQLSANIAENCKRKVISAEDVGFTTRKETAPILTAASRPRPMEAPLNRRA
jgi:hypothetical protein